MNYLDERIWLISVQHSAHARLAKMQLEAGVFPVFKAFDQTDEEEAQRFETQQSVGVLRLKDELTKYGDDCTMGMQKASQIIRSHKGAIVLVWDSPGGTLRGLGELAQAVKEHKYPVVSFIDGRCASAAYWVAAQSAYIIANQYESSHVGSIGVLAIHQDYSKYEEKEGVKTTIIASHPHKVEGNSHEPISDELLAEIQAEVQETYQSFLSAISHRAIASEALTGKTYKYEKALALGLIDELGTLETAINHARKLALINS